MPAATIIISGCDDRTDVTLDLSADELAAIKRLAEAVARASQSSCQPTIQVAA